MERLRAAGCVFAEDEAAILRSTPGDLEAMVRRRVEGTPLEVVVGWAAFGGRRILVDDGVFVPRPRTEALVAVAIGLGGSSVLDLCCGTGAVGLVVSEALGAGLAATDLDPAAIACARRNGVPALLGDLYDPLPPGRFDLITMVAPYVPTDDIRLLPREARLFEPRGTLDGGADGLDVVRAAVAGAPDRLTRGGWFVTEVGEAQADATAAALRNTGLTAAVVRDDEADTTVVTGQYV